MARELAKQSGDTDRASENGKTTLEEQRDEHRAMNQSAVRNATSVRLYLRFRRLFIVCSMHSGFY